MRVHWRYVVAAVVLIAFTFVVSLWVSPGWAQSAPLLIALMAVVVVGVIAFLASLRQAFEQQSPTEVKPSILPEKIEVEPPPSPKVVKGRDTEIRNLAKLLWTKQNKLIVLSGNSGVGKSAIAQIITSIAGKRYFDIAIGRGIHVLQRWEAIRLKRAFERREWLDAQGRTGVDVLRVLLDRLEVNTTNINALDLPGRFRSSSRRRRILFIVNDFDPVGKEIEELRPLDESGCVVLITTKQNADKNSAGLAGADIIRVEPINLDSAKDLFRVHLNDASLYQKEMECAEKICMRYRVFPLGLETSANSIKRRIDQGVSNPIEIEWKVMNDPELGADNTAEPLEIDMRRINRQLASTPALQKCFRRLGVLAGETLSTSFIAALWETDEERTETYLAELRMKGLYLERLDRNWQLHELQRRAIRRLMTSEEKSQARRTLANFFLRLIDWDPHFFEKQPWLASDLRATIYDVFTDLGDDGLIVKYCVDASHLIDYFYRDRSLNWFELAGAKARNESDKNKIVELMSRKKQDDDLSDELRISSVRQQLRKIRREIRDLPEAPAIANGMPPSPQFLNTHRERFQSWVDLSLDLADLLWTAGLPEEANRHFQDAVSIAKVASDSTWLAKAQGAYGEFRVKEINDSADGLTLLREAVRLDGSTDADLVRYARVSRDVSKSVESLNHHLAEAQQMLQHRIDSVSDTSATGFVYLLMEMARVTSELGDLDTALKYAYRAKSIALRHEHAELIPEIVALIGELEDRKRKKTGVPTNDPNLN